MSNITKAVQPCSRFSFSRWSIAENKILLGSRALTGLSLFSLDFVDIALKILIAEEKNEPKRNSVDWGLVFCLVNWGVFRVHYLYME